MLEDRFNKVAEWGGKCLPTAFNHLLPKHKAYFYIKTKTNKWKKVGIKVNPLDVVFNFCINCCIDADLDKEAFYKDENDKWRVGIIIVPTEE